MPFPCFAIFVLFLFLTPARPAGTQSNTPTLTRSPTTSMTSGLTPSSSPTATTSPTPTRSSTLSPTCTVPTAPTPSITPSPSTSPGVYPGHFISVIDTTGSLSPLKSGCTGQNPCGPTIANNGGGGNTYGTSAFYISPHPVFDVLLTSITFPLQSNVCSFGCGGNPPYTASFTADLYFTNTTTSLLPNNLVVSANNVGLGAPVNGTIVTNSARYATLTLRSVNNNWVIPGLPRLPPLAPPSSLYVLVLRATALSNGRLYFNPLATAPTGNAGLLNLTHTYNSANPGFGTPTPGFAFSSVGVLVSGVVLALPSPSSSPTSSSTPTGTSSRGSSLTSTPTPSSSTTPSFSPTPSSTLTPTSTAAAGLRAGQVIAVIDTTGTPSLSSPLSTTGCTGSTTCGPQLTDRSSFGTTLYGYLAVYITPHPVFDVLLTSITFPLQPNVCSGGGCGGSPYYTASFTADLYFTTTDTLLPTTPVVLANNLQQGKTANATMVTNSARYATLPLNSVNNNWMVPAQPRLPSTALNTSLYVLVLRATAISGGRIYLNNLATPPTVNTGALGFTHTSISPSSQVFTAPTLGLGGGMGLLVSGLTLALPSPSPTPTTSSTATSTSSPTGSGSGTSSPTGSGTPSSSLSPSLSPTPSNSPTGTQTPSFTASPNLPLIVNNKYEGLSGGAVAGISVGGILFVGGVFTLFICTQTRMKRAPSKKAPFASSGGSGPVARRQGGLLGLLGLGGGSSSSSKRGGTKGGGMVSGTRPSPAGFSSSSAAALENPTNPLGGGGGGGLGAPTSSLNPMLASFAGPGSALASSLPLPPPFERSEGGGGGGGGDHALLLPLEEAGETFESPPSKWAIAVFDYAPTQGDELGLLPEDRVWVSVLEEVEGWSRGRVCDANGRFQGGVEGLFPTAFVRTMSEAQAQAQGLALGGPKRVRLVKKMVEVEVEEEVKEGEEGEGEGPPLEPEDDTPLPEGWRMKGLKKGASKSGRKLVFYENTVTGAVSYKRPSEPAFKPKLSLKKLDED